MDDASKQALLSAIRSLLIVIGGAMAAHGFINETLVTELVGPIMAIIPIVWGVWDKFNAEKKAAVREVAAVNAGVAVAATGTVGPTVRPADVPEIIKEFAPPTPPKGTP
jgi:hypothetical protein